MGLELPSELTEPLGWIGLIWPQADEEKLFEDGQTWISYGQTLRQQAQQADQTAQGVWTANQGQGIDAFHDWWSKPEGPVTQLEQAAVGCDLIGAGLMVMAAITLAMKVAFIAQLIALAIEVAQAIATAFVSFGATTAEIPGFVAATRVFCRELIEQIVNAVRREISELFLKAGQLLEKVGAKDAARTAERIAARAPRELPKTFEAWMKAADDLQVGTRKNAAHFWSGGEDAMNGARRIADRTGGKTLESTPGGAWLDKAELWGEDSPLTKDEAKQVWAKLSERYASEARGNVLPVIKGTPWEGSIWRTVEKPTLESNPHVGPGRILPPVRIGEP